MAYYLLKVTGIRLSNGEPAWRRAHAETLQAHQKLLDCQCAEYKKTMTPKRIALTVQRDLRSGTPVWLRNGDVRLNIEPLGTNLGIDVAVVGGGVSGALVVDALLRAGKRVAVFDRRGAVKGSTPASTALLQFEIDQPLTHLMQKNC